MFDYAQHDLQPQDARLLKHYIDDATKNEYLVVAFTGLERDRFDEYKTFVEKYTWLTNFESNPNTEQRVVDNPLIGPEQIPYEGAWMRVSVTKADDESSELILTLLRVYNTIADTGKWRAVLLNKDQFRTSEANLVLQFRNLDPRTLDALVKASFTADSFTNIVTKDDTYTGTWYTVASPSAHDETGAGVITLYVTKHNNDDVVYRYFGSANTIVTDFFKYRMLESGKTDLEANYYFDQNGMYYSTDGINYTKLDTVAVDPAVALPATAKRLNQSAPARTVQMSESRREDDRTTDLYVQIVHNADDDETGLIYHDAYGSITTEVQRLNVSETARNNLLSFTYIDASGNWYWSEDAANYTKLNGVAASGALPADAKAANVKVEGRVLDVRAGYSPERDIWDVTIMARHMGADTRSSTAHAGTPFTFKQTGDISMVIAEGFNLSKSDMNTVMAYYTSNPPGVGTVRNIDPKRDAATGTYDYVAVEVTTTGFATSFRIGSLTYHFGFHYAKKPTTDEAAYAADGGATLYLLGEDPGNPGTTLISQLSDTSPSIRYEDDQTWSWNIQVLAKQEVVLEGGDDGAGGKYPLLSYGVPNDEWRLVKRVFWTDIQASGIDLVGEYVDIPANTYGTHGILKGRKLIIRALRNERTEDDVISYDLYENIQTADIEEDDGWFFMGCAGRADRNKQQIYSKATTSALAQIDTTTNTELSTSTNLFNFVEAAHKRYRVVKRERKFFKRRPRLTDLAASPNELASTVLGHMNAVANPNQEPDVFIQFTYDIIRLGEHDFAIERTTSMADDNVYPDEDALSKLDPGETAIVRKTIQVADIEEN